MKAFALMLLMVPLAVPADEAGRASHRAAFRSAVETNGAEAAQAVLGRIDWRGVPDPQGELKRFAAEVGQRQGFDGVRREVNTKLRLLCAGTAMDGTDGTLPVPVTDIRLLAVPVIRQQRVPVPRVQLAAAGAAPVRIEVLTSPVVELPVLTLAGLGTPAGVFYEALDEWTRRYMKRRIWRDESGAVLAPDDGAVLGIMRRELSRGRDADDALIDAYNARMERALWRRKALAAP